MKDKRNLSQAELESIRDELQKELDGLRLSKETSWKSVASAYPTISAWTIPFPNSISYAVSEVEISCSAQELFDHVATNATETIVDWDEMIVHAEKIKDYGNGFSLSRALAKGNLLVAHREDVYIQCYGRNNDGSFYELCRGCTVEEEPISVTQSTYSTVRDNLYFSSKEIVPLDQNKCRYRAIMRCDPGDWLSMILPQTMLEKIVVQAMVDSNHTLMEVFSPPE